MRTHSIVRAVVTAALLPLLLLSLVPIARAGVLQELDGIFKSAEIHFNHGDLSRALDMFTELRRRDSTFRGREVNLYIARCYEAQARLGSAYREYMGFLNRFPNSRSSVRVMVKLIALGRVLGKERDVARLTKRLWKATLDASPEKRAPLLFDLAFLEREAGENASAELFETEVRERFPHSVGAFLLSHRGDY